MPCLLLVIWGVAWRWLTLTHPAQYDLFSTRILAYSDIVKFYFTRHLAAHHLPYLQQNVEYPVLTGVVIWLTALVPTIQGYFLANALLLSACVVASLMLLTRMTASANLWRFALAPALALYTVLNWDALALVALVGSLCALARRHFLAAGILLGVGASAKLFPLFVLPVALAHAAGSAGDDDGRDQLYRALRLALGCGGTILALNLPIALLSPHGWSYFLTYQATRPINLDSIWANVPAIPDAVSSHILVDGMVGGTLYLAWRVWRGAPWLPAAFLSILIFLLLTRDYSPQYDLWVLPFLALLACPFALWLGYVLADLVYYAGIFFFYYLGMPGHGPMPYPDRWATLNGVVWCRELMLIALVAWGVSKMNGTSFVPRWRSLLPPGADNEAETNLALPATRFGLSQAVWLMLALRVGLGLVGFTAVQLQPITFITGAYSNLLIRGGEPWSWFIAIWQRWDAFFYQQIALHGYNASGGTDAFFPLYPLLSRGVSVLLVGNIVVAELVVSSAAFVAAMWLLFRLARLDVSPTAALVTVLLTAFFPTSFFLLAPYTESLFLLLTIAAFWFARQGKPWLAGVAGFGAGLTRTQGAFLVVPLAFMYLQRADRERRGPGFGLLSATLPPLGLILFTAYLHFIVGETHSSLAVQSMWGYRIVPPWQSIADSWQFIAHPLDPTQAPTELLNLVSLIGFSILGLLAPRRLPLSYSLYVWPSLALLFTREMAHSPLMSVSRFVLVLFPCFIVLAAPLAKKPWLALSWLVTSLLLGAVLFIAWVHFVFVA